jgi:hypothetical protein
MRRLLIYFIVDVLGPGNDWPMFVSATLKGFLEKERMNPFALETNCMSIVRLDEPPMQLFPPTYITDINSNEFDTLLEGTRSSGSFRDALKLVADCVKVQRQKQTTAAKSDYPAVVLSLIGNADLSDLSPGSSALAKENPLLSAACSFSTPGDRTLENHMDGFLTGESDPVRVADWFEQAINASLRDYLDGELRDEPQPVWRIS